MWKDIEINPIFRAMQRLRTLATMVLTGKKTMQLFCSDPGFGKTETVLELMAGLKIEPHYTSPANATAFSHDLWHHRNAPYFTDDCDGLARSEPCANIAKMATGSQRLVICPNTVAIQRNEKYRQDGDERYNPDIPPATFNLGDKFGWVWNSNKNYTDPTVISKDMASDFAALVSRGLDPLWIPNDPQSVFDYTLWMLAAFNMLRRHRQKSRDAMGGGFSLEHTNDVIQFFCENARYMKEVSPRAVWKLAMARRHDPQYEIAWKERLSDTLRWPQIIAPDVIPLIVPSPRKRPEPNSPVAIPSPEPESQPSALREQYGPPELFGPPPPARPPVGKVIDVVYALTERTCTNVRAVLDEYGAETWPAEYRRMLAEPLWNAIDQRKAECNMLEAYCQYGMCGDPLFADAEGLLEWHETGLRTRSWDEVRQEIAAPMAEATATRERHRIVSEAQDVYHSKLPAKRKLKAIQERLPQFIAGCTLRGDRQCAVDFIAAMKKDDDRFWDCKTFQEYINRAVELLTPKVIDQTSPPTISAMTGTELHGPPPTNDTIAEALADIIPHVEPKQPASRDENEDGPIPTPSQSSPPSTTPEYEPSEPTAGTAESSGGPNILAVRHAAQEKLGAYDFESATSMANEIAEWEARQPSMPGLFGRPPVVTTARAYRFRFVKATTELATQRGGHIETERLEVCLSIRSSKWWNQHGSDSIDQIFASAMRYRKVKHGAANEPDQDEQ